MQKVLILGGGFAGVRVALDLEKKIGKDYEICLVNQTQYHTFISDLYDVASAFRKSNILRASVEIHLNEIFKGKNIKSVFDEVEGIDLEKKQVFLKKETLDYDYLAVALGSTTAYYGIPGAEQFSVPLKNVEDALRIRNDLNKLCDGQKGVKIVIAGGGFTGVELAGAMGKLIEPCGEITVIEATGKVLGGMPPWAQKAALNRLKKLGVEIKLNCPIKKVEKDKIITEEEEIDFDYLIWTTGVKAIKLEKGVNGAKLNPKDQLVVGSDLSLKDYPEVFAMGDFASFEGAPPAAWVAIEQGKLVAYNLYSRIKNVPTKKFRVPPLQFVVAVGDKFSLTNALDLKITGFLAWVIKEFIALKYFVSILPLGRALNVWKEEVEVDVLDH